MSQAPEEPLDAPQLADAAAIVERRYRIAGFTRLADRVASADGEAEARLEFDGGSGVPTARLRVRAQLVLICQRCLRPLRQTVESTSQLAFVEQDAVAVPAGHEAVSGDARRIDLASLVEDELLLALPLVAIHGRDEDCAAPKLPADARHETPPPSPASRRPFAGLKDLLKH